MLADEPTPPRGRSPREEIAVAVAIAGLSALASGLVHWGIDALRRRVDPEPPKETE